MKYLLFPGRHLVNTKFQEEYIREILSSPISELSVLGQNTWSDKDRISNIVFAVTSANQAHSRYNPIPFYERAIGLDRFARQYKKESNINYRIIGIPHFNPTTNFAEFILKEIAEQSEGRLVLNPKNAIVLCSTPALIKQYSELGFSILPAEYDPSSKSFKTLTPVDLVKKIAEAGEKWKDKEGITSKLSGATLDTWNDFPDIPETLLRLWRDPLLTESGSLTLDRNYSS